VLVAYSFARVPPTAHNENSPMLNFALKLSEKGFAYPLSANLAVVSGSKQAAQCHFDAL
jgi:hypothetical protein